MESIRCFENVMAQCEQHKMEVAGMANSVIGHAQYSCILAAHDEMVFF